MTTNAAQRGTGAAGERGEPPQLLFVVFGATGDLARRKLLPSLLRVVVETGIGANLTLLGVSRSEIGDERFRAWTREALTSLPPGHGLERWCEERVHHRAASPGAGGFAALRSAIEEIEQRHDLPGNRVFYLALPPGAFTDVVAGIGDAGLAAAPGWTRLVVEKPFGRDLDSARRLNDLVHRHFDESQVYRIDHFLGKETVQNLLAFRFANLLFESAWNRDRVESVEITVAEELGVEGRAGYYEGEGVLRDMVQNHLAQLLTLVAMEAPGSFTPEGIRNEKVQLLEAVAPIPADAVALGQYGAGRRGDEELPGYRSDPGVADDSATPTFAALRLAIDNWRWQGVPFYLRTGKRLPRKTTHIAVTFRKPPVCIFHGIRDECPSHRNVLVLVLQPGEGFELRFDVKAPGEPLRLQEQPLRFGYHEAYERIPDAYQTLLADILEGDQTLFVRADEVEASWRLFTPLLDAAIPVHAYPAGTWGPEEADQLLGKREAWILPT